MLSKAFKFPFRLYSTSERNEAGNLLKSFPEYTNALSLIEKNNWKMADLEIKRCIEVVKSAGFASHYVHEFLLQVLSFSQNSQNLFKKSEGFLEEIFKHRKNPTTESFEFLLKQYLKTSPSKAVSFYSSSVFSESFSFFEDSAKSNFSFIFGTALVLKESYKEAADILGNTQSEVPLMKSQIFNNLGISQWLLIKNSCNVPKSDFSLPISSLENSLKAIENLTEIPKTLEFKNKLSASICSNIAEVYLEQLNLNKAVEWIKASLKIFEEQDPENSSKALILLANVLEQNKNHMHAEGIYRTVLSKAENKKNYSEVLALRNYGRLLKKLVKREKEGSEMEEKANELRNALPGWIETSYYLVIPDWSIKLG